MAASEKIQIELYLRYKESSNIDWDTCRKEDLLEGKVQSTLSITPQEESAKDDVEKICKERSLNLQIYNLETLSGRLQARKRKVHGPSLVVYLPHLKKWQVISISGYLAHEELRSFIYGQESLPRLDKTIILDRNTIIEVPNFRCTDCGSHHFRISQDHSGFCAKCGKAYMKITVQKE